MGRVQTAVSFPPSFARTFSSKETSGYEAGPIQHYDHPGDNASLTYEMTPRFKLFTQKKCVSPFKMTSLLTIYLSFIFS